MHFIKQKISLFSLSALFFFGLSAVGETKSLPQRPPPSVAAISIPQGYSPIILKKVSVTGSITGRAADTQVEIELFNPNKVQLEGELQFPLADGQSVSGFALDINGVMRTASAVEKSMGQQVFEDVTRQKVDPALLEKTQGNFYKLRVYPLPPGGSRKVRLDIVQQLKSEADGALTYRLPIAFAEKSGNLDISLSVHGIAPAAVQAALSAETVKAMAVGGGSLLKTSIAGYTDRSGMLTVRLLQNGESPAVSTQTRAGITYFYAEVPAGGTKVQPRPAPERLALVWDASASAAHQDNGKILQVLDGYFSQIKNVSVDLMVLRNDTEKVQRFSVENGDWLKLRQTLEHVVYDGAANPGAVNLPAGIDLALWVGDGIFNFGDKPLQPGKTPMYALSASAGADADVLRFYAQKSGGSYIDLLQTPEKEAVRALTIMPPVLLQVKATGAKDLYAPHPVFENGALTVSGVMTEPEAVVSLAFSDGSQREFHVANQASMRGNMAARRWAEAKLAPLLADKSRHRTEIVQLGKQFSLITPLTSLIVLDDVADYVRYEIEPPEPLLAEYRRLLQQKNQTTQQEKKKHLDTVYRLFQQKETWWEKDFPKGNRKSADKENKASAQAAPRPGERTIDEAESPVLEASDDRARFNRRDSFIGLEGGFGRIRAENLSAAPAVSSALVGRDEIAANKNASGGKSDTKVQSTIALKKWTPDEPYSKRLQDAKNEDLYAVYLDERSAYANSTAFYLDVSDMMFERGQREKALRVLSNLAEMNLENRHILRILGYRLMQAGEYRLAVSVFERVRDLSPNEPQSFRDLGTAYNKAGLKQQAVDALWEVVSRSWDSRFPQIELIALAEMNAVIATAPKRPDTAKMDQRLLRNMPLDLRAVLSWDADNTDIDLWVTDPNGEKAYYGHRLTYQGGRMSPDFTRGYGPEEFSLRKAKPGTYTVQANFYGHTQQIVAPSTTLMLTLSTGFGTAAQKDREVILRLKGKKEVVTVGTFTVK